ncbi:MAG TPA: UDP-N-acetylglucosamine 2-epimerase (non-hydrolyzing) [Coxiellaceae bacterium]|nr:UDP-N-acetylglucosamine 2-epimerase (non-hydrolyzing) [Coxiellaceae bacterium]
MQIVTIVGARPQFIKSSMISKAMLSCGKIEEIVVHTGQHYDVNMSKVFFEELNIPKPHLNLGIGGGLHGQQTGKMLESIEKVLLDINPRCVLIYGDTNSTLAGALAAVKLHIPISHVESGLRSFNNRMPEEINRIVADRISRFLFTPTDSATQNLLNEGVSESSIFQVGDVMYDAALFYGAYAEAKSKIIQQLALIGKNYVLATIHRAENTGDVFRLKNIFNFLSILAKNSVVVVPLHPRTKQVLVDNDLLILFEKNLLFIDPVGYLDMVMLEKQASFIVTDSGGVQKEAFFYRIPCLTLRDETEWVELVKVGWNVVISPTNDYRAMYAMASKFLDNFKPEEKLFYGQGNSSELIVKTLLEHLS